MKKTILIFILVFCILYFLIEFGIKNEDEHSFIGTIIEVSSSYIIVEPNEDEEEIKSSDKFRIELKNNNIPYKVGTEVNITYEGMINESYPAKIETTKIEIISKN